MTLRLPGTALFLSRLDCCRLAEEQGGMSASRSCISQDAVLHIRAAPNAATAATTGDHVSQASGRKRAADDNASQASGRNRAADEGASREKLALALSAQEKYLQGKAAAEAQKARRIEEQKATKRAEANKSRGEVERAEKIAHDLEKSTKTTGLTSGNARLGGPGSSMRLNEEATRRHGPAHSKPPGSLGYQPVVLGLAHGSPPGSLGYLRRRQLHDRVYESPAHCGPRVIHFNRSP